MMETLKSKITTIVTIMMFSALLISGVYTIRSYEVNYVRTGLIIDIDNDSKITVEDVSGNLWTFEGNGYEVGQTVRMSMTTNNTDNVINDDTINDVIVVDKWLAMCYNYIINKQTNNNKLLKKRGKKLWNIK